MKRNWKMRRKRKRKKAVSHRYRTKMEGTSERYVSNAYFAYVFSALLNIQDNHYKMLHKIYRSLSTLE